MVDVEFIYLGMEKDVLRGNVPVYEVIVNEEEEGSQGEDSPESSKGSQG